MPKIAVFLWQSLTKYSYKRKLVETVRFYLPLHTVSHNSNGNLYSNNRMITDLVKSGSLDTAHRMFAEMSERDVITWNIMISGYYRFGFSKESMILYIRMVNSGMIENSSTFSTVLSLCSSEGFYAQGLVVHCKVIVLGFSRNLYIGSALVDLYMKMGRTDIGYRLFRNLPERNLAAWNVVLRGVCDTGRSKELLRLYYEMKIDNVEPNGVTFCYLIRGCGYERFLDEGMQLHCLVTKNGLVNSNLFVANSLVDFYSACGSFFDAWESFNCIPPEDVISWNSMVSVCAGNGYSTDAIEIFREMQFFGKKPSASSFLGFLKLSSATKSLLLGKQIHGSVLKLNLNTTLLQSSLIDMYGKCGDIESSVAIFESVPERTLECCNCLMSSLLRFGLNEDVIELFGLMVDGKIGYDEASLSTTLKALSLSTFASTASCSLLHCCSIKSGFKYDITVSCSLIDAYSRLGGIEFSRQVFNQIASPNVICFTSIISALARNGYGVECLEMFDTMTKNGLKPDKVTFLSVLTGCSHSGLVDEGRLVFHAMQTRCGLHPERQHYSCMVDLLGRAGLVNEAEKLLKDTPWQGDAKIWSSILRSCTIHHDEQAGKRAAKILIDIDPEDPALWLQASNFYYEIGDYETSKEFREVAVARKMTRDIGQSFIEVLDHG
ncbi:pentatricopeptide repeat-containing protein-like [Dorcoceras hygrometricum]|uniref:Pentatricopeptide repeat-containing protein-like n=1 Tax=Dorcoceras hygrometricum TaxID=472368 RepID=A0A2Z7C7R0_9LAMI|nr:pentatricopeptide repeat-containing protein-like [Dorcoceras hygrometricum]